MRLPSLFLTVAALLPCMVAAAPRLPSGDAEVLEQLPARRDDPSMAELRQLRAAAAAAPRDPAAAASLTLRYFELANAEGDPRYVGYAEGALRAWKEAEAPAEILFVRALLRQYRHDFAGALADLQRTLQQDPAHVEARAWRAAIFMVQADYVAAARECAALVNLASELLAAGCGAYVEATTGHTQDAYQRLADVLRRHPGAGAEARLWTLTRLAEMAARLGNDAGAERHFREALALGINDNFLLAAYADFLLDRDRPKEAVALLKDWVRADTLLLRLAIAEGRLKLPAAKAHVQALADRFAASALRGERLHLAEESRFLLRVKGDAPGALAAAVENWKSQREPRDAAALLEAALAARDPAAAAPAIRWLDQSGFESAALRRIAAQLR